MKLFLFYRVFLVMSMFISLQKDITKVEIYSGWLSAYDKEPTDATIAYRLSTGDIEPGYAVHLAVLECERIGETGLIIFDDGSVERYTIFDCASRNPEDKTRQWFIDHSIVGELDFYSWERHPNLGRAKLITDSHRQ